MEGADRSARSVSDLGVRAMSASVLLVIAGAVLVLGGVFWIAFVGAVALSVFWEWVRLVHGITAHPVSRGLWNASGLVYLLVVGTVLALARVQGSFEGGMIRVGLILAAVIATDVGAYFAGRTIGGPKIAPRIAPSKTWAGLGGGMLAAGLVVAVIAHLAAGAQSTVPFVVGYAVAGAGAAIVAQAGDFFESWMKRRAGVKDSSALIPGHGGLFDRVDGLLSVCFVTGIGIILTSGFGQAETLVLP